MLQDCNIFCTFQLLAVGVDNLFMLVHCSAKISRSGEHPVSVRGDVPSHLGEVASRMGPTMLFSTVTQTTTFFLGYTIQMPALR